ncbi:MAG: hypothetical protein L6Q99_10900 [Planctomycetes bacterium]|nr:hypothetical protein [Planctomycetota bacterium]
MIHAPRSVASLVPALSLVVLSACRDGETETTRAIAIVPSPLAAAGCTGPDQVFTAPQTPSQVALAVLDIGPTSQVCAAGDSETLFATGDQAQVVALDVSGGAPVETELVAAGTIAALLNTLGVTSPPELGGIAVLDADTLLVIEMTSNTILSVDRTTPDTVELWAGLPSETPGFADGPAVTATADCPLGFARFGFTTPTALCPTGTTGGSVYVADPANHALRLVSGGCVTTVCGLGAPQSLDGTLGIAGFDTPVGISTRCAGALLVVEAGGNKLRELGFTSGSFGVSGSVTTLAGDGTEATTQGDGEAAQLAAPVSVLSTSEGDVYWLDSATGILRRMSGAADSVDCPLAVDCASAIADFTPGGVLSLSQTPAGALYVLDADADTLFRVTP